MDDQLIVTWVYIIVLALVLDLGANFFLRWYWKKNDVILMDVLLNTILNPVDLIFEKVDQFGLWLRALFSVKPQTIQTPVLAQADAEIVALLEPEAVLESASEITPEADSVEVIPVSVEHINGVRRVRFSLDMPLNTTVDVRIGATQESGVTIEKRELS